MKPMLRNKPTEYAYYDVQTPTGKMKIETTITHKAADVDEWIHEISCLRRDRSTVVGVDTEWIKSHEDENKTRNFQIAVLQICVGEKCLIFQNYWKDEEPSSLGDFLMNPNFTFVGVGIDQDLAMLRDEYGLHCAISEDVAAVAKAKWPEKWMQTPGLKILARDVAGIEIEKNKAITMSNWGLWDLSEQQKEYACLDAYVSYKVGVQLQHDFKTGEVENKGNNCVSVSNFNSLTDDTHL